MSAKPTPPCVRALDADGTPPVPPFSPEARDADGSKFRIDATGRAFRLDSSRVPELDGPPSSAPLDRAEVVRVLAEEWLHCDRKASRFLDASQASYREWQANRHQVTIIAVLLGLFAEFDAACKEVGRG